MSKYLAGALVLSATAHFLCSCALNEGASFYVINERSGVKVTVSPKYRNADRRSNFTGQVGTESPLYMYKSPRYIHLYAVSLNDSRHQVVFIRNDKTVAQVKPAKTGISHVESAGATSDEEVNYALVTEVRSEGPAGFKEGDKLRFSDDLDRITPEEMPLIRIGSSEFRAELARGDSETARGLMFRHKLSAKDCMLFVFDGEYTRNFWMRNTLLPLTVIFVRADLTIDSYYDMEVYDDPSTQNSPTYVSKTPCKYVIEVSKGAAKNIAEGDKVEFKFAINRVAGSSDSR